MANIMDYNADAFIRTLTEIGAECDKSANAILTSFWYEPNNGSIHREINDLFIEFFGPWWGLDEVTQVFSDIDANNE